MRSRAESASRNHSDLYISPPIIRRFSVPSVTTPSSTNPRSLFTQLDLVAIDDNAATDGTQSDMMSSGPSRRKKSTPNGSPVSPGAPTLSPETTARRPSVPNCTRDAQRYATSSPFYRFGNDVDYYAYNQLASFSFGTSTPSTLATTHSYDSNLYLRSSDTVDPYPTSSSTRNFSDVTPRPSVVVNTNIPDSHDSAPSTSGSSYMPHSHPASDSSEASLLPKKARRQTLGGPRSSSSLSLSSDVQSDGRSTSSQHDGSEHTGDAEFSDDEDYDYYDSHDDDERLKIEISREYYDDEESVSSRPFDEETEWDRRLFSASSRTRRSVDSTLRGSPRTPTFPPLDDQDVRSRPRRPSRLIELDLAEQPPQTRPEDKADATASPSEAQIAFLIDKGKGKERAEDSPPVTESAIDTEFDMDWSDITKGIKSFDDSQVAVTPVDVRKPAGMSPKKTSPSWATWNFAVEPPDRRPSTATVGTIGSGLFNDSFMKAVGGWSGPEDKALRQLWTFVREKADGNSGVASSPSSPNVDGFKGLLSPRSPLAGPSSVDKDKKPVKVPWQGMNIGAEEIWRNDLLGRFKVLRRVSHPSDTTKNLQHGLTVYHFRDSFTRIRIPMNGPPITVHKHSRAKAFSISRAYRLRSISRSSKKDDTPQSPRSRDSQKPPIILLAPKRVQVAFTSTTTTRTLASHGLLQDSVKQRLPALPDVARNVPRNDDATRAAAGPSSHPFRNFDMFRIVHPRRELLDDDDDIPAMRTSHKEAFSVLDADPDERPPHDVLYKPPWVVMAQRDTVRERERIANRLNDSFKDVGLVPALDKDKFKSKSSKTKKKKPSSPVKHSPRQASQPAAVNIFENVPSDSLFMLLPLWPGETDPHSERLAPQLARPTWPCEHRQYLLVYYVQQSKDNRRELDSRDKKKHLWDGHEHDHKRSHDVLLSSFHVTARLVHHSELQGTGMRIPDEGITVCGPISEALSSMPQELRTSELDSARTEDWIIGVCHSRETGIEFYPDGLQKVGLCRLEDDPEAPMPPYPEDYEPPPPSFRLTPVGRAVLEMAWLGCIALTSFQPAES